MLLNTLNILQLLKAFFVVLFVLAIFFSVCITPINADILNFDLDTQISEGITAGGDMGDYISTLYDVGVAFAGAAAFLVILIGGLEYIISAGNPGKIDDAKDRIRQAIYGIILLLGSVALLRTINPELVSLTPPGMGIY